MNLQTLIDYAPMLGQGTLETLYMTVVSVLFSYILGLPLGVLVVITGKNSLASMPKFNAVLGWIVNIGRSIPFIILMVALIPFTRMVVGKSIGSTAACVPLIIGAAPFVARLVETSLEELDYGVIEAAKAMGATNWQIIYKVMLPEAVPSLVRGVSIATITLIGYSAMAGAVGGGGLGDIAIRYGYHRYEYEVMLITIVLLVIIVQVIQSIFNLVARRIDKRNR
ncbi:methionine ABC transporter permease [Acetanaerobacterium elongatum]|uniref:D-methionine transport system permease protein n=1 Tax=Acetanaerobacterium elongatum TaxID=258515 RepID=A0A1G9YQH1_9FIRM|nr:methionine ABC transporter permease [Acetanaerobacterium elongatum]SDN11227.1 D-methionine transport system permease protein [Acetanaerobacterium elongatum]